MFFFRSRTYSFDVEAKGLHTNHYCKLPKEAFTQHFVSRVYKTVKIGRKRNQNLTDEIVAMFKNFVFFDTCGSCK